jgi:excisionase family DNA binding protein
VNWLTIEDVASRAHASKDTAYRAASDGSLHSHQRVQRGKRLIADPVVDAWIRGEDEAAQIRACGCGLRVVRSA